MAFLLYGAGLRLLECARLRVKDVDFAANQIAVRSAKGYKDRVTLLPMAVRVPLQRHLSRVHELHVRDLAVQELPRHKDVGTTMIYTHVLNRGPGAVRSPADACWCRRRTLPRKVHVGFCRNTLRVLAG